MTPAPALLPAASDPAAFRPWSVEVIADVASPGSMAPLYRAGWNGTIPTDSTSYGALRAGWMWEPRFGVELGAATSRIRNHGGTSREYDVGITSFAGQAVYRPWASPYVALSAGVAYGRLNATWNQSIGTDQLRFSGVGYTVEARGYLPIYRGLSAGVRVGALGIRTVRSKTSAVAGAGYIDWIQPGWFTQFPVGVALRYAF